MAVVNNYNTINEIIDSTETLKKENEELRAKVASMEENNDKAKQPLRDEIASLIPRNLPAYRSDEDFEKEVELRIGQIGEYVSIQDLRDLYDAKMYKHAKNIAARTASMTASSNFYNPLDDIVGSNMVHRNNRIRSTRVPQLDTASMNASNRKGRTASLENNSMWYLDLFSDIGSTSRG